MKIEGPFEGCQIELKNQIKHSDASFHIALHYYDKTVPLERLRPSDQDDDGSGWSRDDKEKIESLLSVRKYLYEIEIPLCGILC